MNALIRLGVGKVKQKERLRAKKILSVLTLGAVLMSGSVSAADEWIPFDIAPQNLSSALKELAVETDVQMLYASELVQNLSSRGVVGTYTKEEALRRLLDGTGITFKRSGDNTYILQRLSDDDPLRQGSRSELPTMVVTATRTERDVREVPASVTVITAQEIEEQHAVTPEELLKNVEGVDLKVSAGGLPAEVLLRGLPSTFAGTTTQYLVNGLPVEPILISNRIAWQLVAPEDIERIEVVRGPASALYGPNAAGGVINIITKEGEGRPSASVKLGAGSHDSYSASVSAGGSVDKFRYRIGARQFKTDGFRALREPDPWGGLDLDGRDSEDKNLNARIGYSLTDDQEISLGYLYFDSEGAWLGGHPNYRWSRDGYAADLSYRNRISDRLEIKAKLLDADYTTARTFDWDYWGDLGNLALAERDREEEKARGGEIQTDIRILNNNTLTLGASYNIGELSFEAEDDTGAPTGSTSAKSSVLGFYAQDEHKFGNRVILTLGGRYDKYKFYDTVSDDVEFPDSEDNVFNPRAGIRVKVAEKTSVYASAGRAYLPALNTLKFRRGGSSCTSWCDNPDLKPERSTSYELGMDQEDIGGFLNAKAAVFHTTYTDKITAISLGANFWPRQFQNIGEIEVNGLEVALNGAFGEYWYPFFNYTYTDAEITENPSEPATVGNVPAFVPKHKANVGIAYDNPAFVTARLAGRYVGSKYYTESNLPDQRADNFFVTDLKISKQFRFGGFLDRASVSFAVNNLFDEEYSEYIYEVADERNYWVEIAAGF